MQVLESACDIARNNYKDMVRKYEETSTELNALRHSHAELHKSNTQFRPASVENQHSKTRRADDSSFSFSMSTSAGTNLDDKEGIVDPNAVQFMPHNGDVSPVEIRDRLRSAGMERPGAWDTPDSWAVKKVGDESGKIDNSNLTFPLRLPLPTEEELHPERDRELRLQHPPAMEYSSSSDAPTSRGSEEAPSVEIFKSFRVSMEDPAEKVLPAALKKYGIDAVSSDYTLYIMHGDQERRVGKQEKPLILFKQLDKEGRKPMFMLKRHLAHEEDADCRVHQQQVPRARSGTPPTLQEVAAQKQRYLDEGFGANDPAVEMRQQAGFEDSILGEPDGEEYSDEEDDALEEKEAPQEGYFNTEKRIVEDLLRKYTTWRSTSCIQLPGGVL